MVELWSAKANGRERKSCLGRVFNFKLGCFVMCTITWLIQARPSLELKTWPRFPPVSISLSMEYKKGKYHCTIDLLFDWFGISCMTTDNFCFYFQNRLIQTSQTGGQQYSVPWFVQGGAKFGRIVSYLNPLELCSDHFPGQECDQGNLNKDATMEIEQPQVPYHMHSTK